MWVGGDKDDGDDGKKTKSNSWQKNHLGRSSSSNSFVQLFLLLLPGERLSGRNKGAFENSWTVFHCVTFLPQPPLSCLSFLAAFHQKNFPIILQNLITVQARKEWSNKKLDLDISPEKEGHHRSVAPPVEVGCNSNCERWHQRRQFRPNIPHGRSIPAATQIANNTSPKLWMRWCFGLSLQCRSFDSSAVVLFVTGVEQFRT